MCKYDEALRICVKELHRPNCCAHLPGIPIEATWRWLVERLDPSAATPQHLGKMFTFKLACTGIAAHGDRQRYLRRRA